MRRAHFETKRGFNATKHKQRRVQRPDNIRVVLLVAICLVGLFAMYLLFLWPSINTGHSHDHIIEDAQEQEDRLANVLSRRGRGNSASHFPASRGGNVGGHVRGAVANADSGSGSDPAAQQQKKEVVAKLKAQLSDVSDVAREYDIPTFPRTGSSGPTYPLRAPQKVWSMAYCMWRMACGVWSTA